MAESTVGTTARPRHHERRTPCRVSAPEARRGARARRVGAAPARPEGGPLVHTRRYVATAGQSVAGAVDERAARRQAADFRSNLRHVLWEILPLRDACSRCGRRRKIGVGEVWIEVHGSSASFSGLEVCKQWAVCPPCAAKAAARQHRRLSRMLVALAQFGGCVAMLTLTLRHHKGHPLADLLDAARKGWRAVRQDRGGRELRELLGCRGLVRVIECTHGDHGWHPHFHVLLIFDAPTSLPMAEQLGLRMHSAWERSLNRQGFESWAESGGCDVRVPSPEEVAEWAAGYFTKQGLASEVTAGAFKRGHLRGRAPFELLAAAGDGDDEARRLFLEFRAAIKGWQQLGGLAEVEKWLGLDPFDEDDEDDDDEDTDPLIDEDTADARLIGCTGAVWDEIARRRLDADLRATVHAALDVYRSRAAGRAAARRWFDEHGLPYLLPGDVPPPRDEVATSDDLALSTLHRYRSWSSEVAGLLW